MMEVVKLEVPYRSQWDRDANSHSADCGPTSLAMLLNAQGTDITPNAVYDHLPAKKRGEFVKIGELMKASAANKLPLRYKRFSHHDEALNGLKATLDDGFAPIALVSYAPWQEFTRNRFRWGHFVVVTGYTDEHIFLHDPLFGLWEQRGRGKYLRMPQSLFLDGWGGFNPAHNPNFAVIIPTKKVNVDREVIDLAKLDELKEQLEPDDKPRIRALAAYIGADPPDLEQIEQLEFWLNNVGDWGKKTKIHRVRATDTLGGIASKYYGSATRWRAIQTYNNLSGTSIWLGTAA